MSGLVGNVSDSVGVAWLPDSHITQETKRCAAFKQHPVLRKVLMISFPVFVCRNTSNSNVRSLVY